MPNSIMRRITWRTADVARILVLGTLFLFLWKFFWLVHTALFLGVIALLIAIILYAPVPLLTRWMPFKVAFTLSVLVFLGALTALLVSLIPQVVSQLSQLAGQLPAALQLLTDWVESKTNRESSGQLLQGINDELSQFVGRFVPLAFNLISVAVGSIAILVLAIFMAAEPDTYRDLLLRLAPPEGRESLARVYDESGRSLRLWVLGKLLTMAMTGVFIGVGLTLFDVPGAIALGALAAVMEFIPNFGPTIAAVPAIISAFLVSPATALWVTLYFFAFQQVQAAITVPLVERRTVDIPPAALLLWQLMLAVGFGILGLFVATPLLAVISAAVRILYLEPREELSSWDRREVIVPAELVESDDGDPVPQPAD